MSAKDEHLRRKLVLALLSCAAGGVSRARVRRYFVEFLVHHKIEMTVQVQARHMARLQYVASLDQARQAAHNHLKGFDAIGHAASYGLRLSKYADATGRARDNLSVHEAREIASKDASLIYLDTAAGASGGSRRVERAVLALLDTKELERVDCNVQPNLEGTSAGDRLARRPDSRQLGSRDRPPGRDRHSRQHSDSGRGAPGADALRVRS